MSRVSLWMAFTPELRLRRFFSIAIVCVTQEAVDVLGLVQNGYLLVMVIRGLTSSRGEQHNMRILCCAKMMTGASYAAEGFMEGSMELAAIVHNFHDAHADCVMY